VLADDSNFFLKRLKAWLEADGDMEVVGTAIDGVEAVEKTRDLRPDLIVLDVRMPKLDGLGALLQIMRAVPTPVLLYCEKPGDPTREQRLRNKAMELGALDVLYKPQSNDLATEEGGSLGNELRHRVRMLSKIKVVRLLHTIEVSDDILTPPPGASLRVPNSGVPQVVIPQPTRASDMMAQKPESNPKELARERRIVLIGSSTGGPDAVRVVLSRMPATFPHPVVIAQHMPRNFTRDFALQLSRICPLPVKEAASTDIAEGGHIYVAPGGMNLFIHGLGFRLEPASKGLQENTPCIDEMFASGASRYKDGVVAVVLTGMGNDGERGVKLIKQFGGVVIAQNESTSDIFGMPKMAIATGCVDMIVPVQDVANWIVHYTMSPSRSALAEH